MVHLAQYVHFYFGITPCFAQGSVKLLTISAKISCRIEQALIEQLIQQQWMACQKVAGPARSADEIGNTLQSKRVLLQ